MKLTVFFILLGLFQVQGNVKGQTVSLSFERASLGKVLQEVSRQSKYSLLLDADLLEHSGRVSIHLTNCPLKQALDVLFQDQPLVCDVVGHEIIVKAKPGFNSYANRIDSIHKDQKVRGRVVDSLGNPLQGASVRILGTNQATQTNQKGEFVFTHVADGAILNISYIGYKTLNIRAKSDLGRIVLYQNISDLNGISVTINTGYQSIPKERVTGSFGVIDKNQLDKPTIDIASRLIGQVAGLQSNVDANGNTTFEVRGKSSLYANASPLIVVDGFAIQGGFNSINPNDVENVTILKDAAAASIWGARSANGVIVITTKKANKRTPMRVDLNVFTRVANKLDLDYVNPLASSSETIEFEKLLFSKNWSIFTNSGSLSDYYKSYSLASTAIHEYNLGFITEAEKNTQLDKLKGLSNKQQISDFLLSNPISTQVNLSLSGGTERMTNNLSVLYETNQADFTGNSADRYMLNYNSSSKVFKWLDFNMGAMLQFNNNHNNGVSISDIKGLSPYEMLLDEQGNYTNISNDYYWPVMERYVPMDKFPYSNWEYNPIQEMRNRDLNTKQINLRVQGGLTFHILKGLSFESKLQYERNTVENRSLYNDQTFEVRQLINESSTWDQVTNKITPNLPKGSILYQNKSGVESYSFRNQLNFNAKIGKKNEINFVAGTEMNNIVSQRNGSPATYGYNDETLTVGNFPNGPGGNFHYLTDFLGSGQSFGYTNSFSYATDRYFSLYGNLGYTFNRKYSISASARTDASNLITDDPAYRYAPFWSVGGSWNLIRENFMKNVNWINDLKLRLTYGYNGNVDKSTAFRPLISLNSTPDVRTGEYSARISSYGNPTLRWERTGTWNFGLDFSLLQNKLFGKAEFYKKYGKDLIASLSIPSVNGTRNQKLNNAEMTNTGLELTLGTFQRIKGNDIVWRGSVNFSYNDNEVTKLFVAQYTMNLIGGAFVEGKNANTAWAYEYAGIRESDNQPIYKGAGNDYYDFATLLPPVDGREYIRPLGTKVAPYGLGFNSQFKVYDFDLSFIITGKFGHVFKRHSFNYPGLGGKVLPNVKLREVMNGDPNKIVPLPLNDLEPGFYRWSTTASILDYLYTSAAHIRMQEVNLTYNLSKPLLNKLRIKGNFSLYAQGNNLFTMVANTYGEDPAYPMGSINPRPQYTFGAKLNF